MKRKLLILFACFIGIKVAAQVDVMHYKMMYDTIVTTLNMDKAYVSDSLWEFEYRQLQSCKVISRDSCRVLEERRLKEKMSLGNHSDEPYKYLEREAEYSDLLHSNFVTIAASVNTWNDLICLSSHEPDIIFFSSSYKSYVCADVYVHVFTRCSYTSQYDVPIWGYREDWYTFLFEVKENSVSLLNYSQVQGL
jgi:hypothetical protein